MASHPEGERFKALNLGEFATAYGYALDRRESSKSSLVMRHADGDKIVIATGEDRHAVFFSVKADASGSIFDFVMYREKCGFPQALHILRSHIPFPTVPAAIPKPRPIPHDRAALVAGWHRMRPYAGGYLEARGLNAATIAAFADRIRTDGRGNTVFRHDDLTGLSGWEIKNRGFTGYAKGAGRRCSPAAWGCPAPPTRRA